MLQNPNADAVKHAMLARTIKSIEETNAIIRAHLTQDRALAQREAQLQQQLKQVKFEREQLKTTVEACRASKKSMETAADGLKNVLSPMRTLPTETLLRIFYIVIVQQREYCAERLRKWSPIGTAPRAIIILRQVCSRWRSIVNNNAKLWDQIVIRGSAAGAADPAAVMAREVLRAAHWTRHGVQSNQKLLVLIKNMEVLKSVVGSRPTPWNSLDIALAGWNGPGQWDVKAVSATEVTIYRQKQAAPFISFITPLLQFASKLTLMGMPPVWGDRPWASLQTLQILPYATSGLYEDLTFGSTELWALLNAAPNLRTLGLSFTIKGHVPPAHGQARTVEHRSLQSLSLPLHHFTANAGPFGIQMNIPSLRSLTIESLATPDPPTEGGFLIGKWEQITSLRLCKLQQYDIPTVIGLLRQVPNIESLYLEGAHIDKLFIHVNAFYQHIPPTFTDLPLSKLTDITLDTTDIRGETLIELLEIRFAHLEGSTQGVQLIKSVVTYESPGVTPENWKRVNTLLERRLVSNGALPGNDVDMTGP